MKWYPPTFVILLFSLSSYSQSLNLNWSSELDSSLEKFKNCQDEESEISCQQFPGRSLDTVYDLDDFYKKTEKRYLSSYEISELLKDNSRWSRLGHAYEPDILKQAQDNANAKKAVVAVYMNEAGEGHMALILPGELQPSGSWGLNVPNSASFFSKDPSKSYVNKGLSYAFSKKLIKDVLLYTRKY